MIAVGTFEGREAAWLARESRPRLSRPHGQTPEIDCPPYGRSLQQLFLGGGSSASASRWDAQRIVQVPDFMRVGAAKNARKESGWRPSYKMCDTSDHYSPHPRHYSTLPRVGFTRARTMNKTCANG